MPHEFSDCVSDSGMAYVRVETHGRINLADSQELAAQLRRPSAQLPKFLSIVAKGVDYEPEARRFAAGLDRDYSAAAVVVTNPIVRAIINLMIRMKTEYSGPVRLFQDEAEALAWLEQQPFRLRGD